MVDIASLAVKIDTGDAGRAAADLDKLATKGGAAAKAIDKSLTEAAKAAGVYRDATGKLREPNGRFVSDAKRIELGLKSVGKEARNAGSELTSMGGMATRLGGLLAGAFSIREVIQAAEQYTQIANRLKLVTEGIDQLAYAQAEVARIAISTNASLEATATVYQRLAQGAKAAGLNFEEVGRITATVNRAVAMSGASAQGAEAALFQLGQGLGSGALRGEELNSVLEQTPALAQAIARGLGLTIGELRAFAAEGKLTTDKVIEALQNQEAAVESMAKSMSITIGQASTNFSTALTVAIGKLDEASGASRATAAAINDLATALNGFSSGEFGDFFRDKKQTAEGFNNEIGVTLSKVRDLRGVIDRLDKSDPTDRAFFKMGFYNRAELEAQVKDLEAQAGKLRAARDNLIAKVNAPAAETPKGDAAPAETVNAEYTKYLDKLKESAALHGLNTEEAKIRYAVESGQLGVLTAAQTASLIAEAKTVDAKRASTEAVKEAERAATSASREAQQEAEQQARQLEQLRAQQESYVAGLEKQAATLGMSAVEARQYEVAERGLTGALRERAEASIAAIAAAEKQRDYQSLVQELRTDEERLNDQLRERLKLIDSMPKLSEEGRKRATDRSIDGAFQAAPEFSGIDASVGGPFGELNKVNDAERELDDWYARQLKMLEDRRQERADLNANWDAKELQLKQEHEAALANIEQARQYAMLAGAEYTFGNLADLAQQFAGEQSGIYKVMFAAQKAAAIAQSAIAIQQGIAMAAANPWPVNLAAMASVAAATAGIVGNIAAIGMAHDGIDNIPREGTWLLDKGERVVDRRTNGDLKQFLSNQSQPAANGPINITVNQPGVTNAREARESSAAAARRISRAVQGAGRYS